MVGSSFADGPDMEKAYKTCAPKFPTVDSKVLDQFCEPSFQASDKETKCLMKCIGEETGFATADGKIILSKFKSAAPTTVDPVKLDTALTNCSSVIKPDACDTAYDQWKCLCDADRAAKPKSK